jgi:starvation-inducible DNA-binding protein
MDMRTSSNRPKLVAPGEVMHAAPKAVAANRALLLLERTGEEWRFARAHSWYAPGKDTDIKTSGGRVKLASATPSLEGNASDETGRLRAAATPFRLGMTQEARGESIEGLTQLLADSIALRDLYKKHHWQVVGPNFYALHLLFDKHAGEQTELVDSIAERVETLGGTAIAISRDVAAMTQIEMPPRGHEQAVDQLTRLLKAHEQVLIEARALAQKATQLGDDGTADLVVGEIVRTNEAQAWFLHEHLAGSGPEDSGLR